MAKFNVKKSEKSILYDGKGREYLLYELEYTAKFQSASVFSSYLEMALIVSSYLKALRKVDGHDL